MACKLFACNLQMLPTVSSSICQSQLDVVQGLLTLAEPDIEKLVEEDITTLAAFLGTKRFFFGNEPSATDACVFGFLEREVSRRPFILLHFGTIVARLMSMGTSGMAWEHCSSCGQLIFMIIHQECIGWVRDACSQAVYVCPDVSVSFLSAYLLTSCHAGVRRSAFTCGQVCT